MSQQNESSESKARSGFYKHVNGGGRYGSTNILSKEFGRFLEQFPKPGKLAKKFTAVQFPYLEGKRWESAKALVEQCGDLYGYDELMRLLRAGKKSAFKRLLDKGATDRVLFLNVGDSGSNVEVIPTSRDEDTGRRHVHVGNTVGFYGWSGRVHVAFKGPVDVHKIGRIEDIPQAPDMPGY